MLRKARTVILGNKDYTVFGNVFAPTVHRTPYTQSSVVLLLAIVVFYRLKIKNEEL